MVAGTMGSAPNAQKKHGIKGAAAIAAEEDSSMSKEASNKGSMAAESMECSMCGDVGFASELFHCKKCLFRYQHTYCSRFYPDMRDVTDTCDWCSQGGVLKNQQQQQPQEQVKKKKAQAGVQSSEVNHMKTNKSSDVIVQQQRGHYGNALELLLEVAQTVAASDHDNANNQLDHHMKQLNGSSSSKKRRRASDGNRASSKLPPSSNNNKNIGSRRYKLLSDVLLC